LEQRLIGRAIRLFQLRAVFVGVSLIGVEERITHVDGTDQYLTANRREQFLAAHVPFADGGGPALKLGHALREVVARKPPRDADQRKAHEEGNFNRGPGQRREPSSEAPPVGSLDSSHNGNLIASGPAADGSV